MKKLFAIIVIMTISSLTFAQITDIYPSKDSSIVIDKVYAGMLSGVMFSVDSLHSTSFAGVRFGAMATYKPAKWIAFKTWGMYEVSGPDADWSMSQFWTKISPTKKLTLEAGYMATLATEQRPHPVSSGGQFESWGESQIPGGALSAKLKYQFTPSFQLAGGIALRSKLPEYSGRITYKKVQLSGWYAECDSLYGSALTLDFDRVYSTLVFKQDKCLGDILIIKLSKKEDISIFSSVGYDLGKKDLVNGEWGVFKGFSSKYIKGLVALSYKHGGGIGGYLFIHL